ncbi:hypothetical protein VCHENC02_1452A, partial [Vibrio harveyi]
MIHIGQT